MMDPATIYLIIKSGISVTSACTKYVNSMRQKRQYNAIVSDIQLIRDNHLHAGFEALKQASQCRDDNNAIVCVNNALALFTLASQQFEYCNTADYWHIPHTIKNMESALEKGWGDRKIESFLCPELSVFDSKNDIRKKINEFKDKLDNYYKWEFACRSIATIFCIKKEWNNACNYLDQTLSMDLYLIEQRKRFYESLTKLVSGIMGLFGFGHNNYDKYFTRINLFFRVIDHIPNEYYTMCELLKHNEYGYYSNYRKMNQLISENNAKLREQLKQEYGMNF